jgi:hypothetical protein
MDTPRFDPSHSVEFNLARGLVKVEGGSPRLLLPADALAALIQAVDSDTRKDFAHRVGSEAGRRAAERLKGDSTLEVVVDHLGGELALMGLGSFGIERWGRALVVTFSHAPFGPDGDELLALVVEGALQRAFGREVGVVPIQRQHPDVRLLVLSRGVTERVRSWLAAGTSYSEVIARLHEGATRGGA